MTDATIVLATLIAYKLVLISIGVLTRRRIRDGADFFLGGRQLGPLVAAVSASASSSSAWTLLGVSGAAWAWGLGAVWLFPACVGGFLLNWYVLAPRLRRHAGASGALTVSEVLAGPPGTPLRAAVLGVASAIVLVALTIYVAAQFQGAGKTFAETFDLSETLSILLGAAIVLVYMFLGGFWAVSITDTLQGLVMVASCIVLPIAALVHVGGPGELIAALQSVPVDGFQSPARGATGAAAVGFVLGLLGIGLGYPGQPHVVNRFMALREGAGELRRARAIAIGWAVIVYAGMLILGWSGRVLAEGLADRERIFIVLTNELLHPVVAGVMLAAVLSAVMSTADSQLLVAASAVTSDLGIGRSSRLGLLARSRVVVVLLGVVAVVAALVGSEEIFSRVLSAWTAMGAAFGPVLLLAVFGVRVPPWGVVAGMLVGFGLAVTFHAFPETRGGVVGGVLPYVGSFGVALGAGVLRGRDGG